MRTMQGSNASYFLVSLGLVTLTSSCFTSGSYLNSTSSRNSAGLTDIKDPGTVVPTTTGPTEAVPNIVLNWNASSYLEPSNVLRDSPEEARVGLVWNLRDPLNSHYGSPEAVQAAAIAMAQQRTLNRNFFEIRSAVPKATLIVPASDLFSVTDSTSSGGTLEIRHLVVLTSRGGIDNAGAVGRTLKFYSIPAGYPSKDFFAYIPIQGDSIGSLMLLGGMSRNSAGSNYTWQNRITGVELINNMGTLPDNWAMGLLPSPLTSDMLVLKNLDERQLCDIYIKHHNYVNSSPTLQFGVGGLPADCETVKRRISEFSATNGCVSQNANQGSGGYDPTRPDINNCAFYSRVAANPYWWSIYVNTSAMFVMSHMTGKLYELRAIVPDAQQANRAIAVSICSINSLTGTAANPCDNSTKSPSSRSFGAQWFYDNMVTKNRPIGTFDLSAEDLAVGRVLVP